MTEVAHDPLSPETITDLADPTMLTDPFPFYAELRRSAPISRAKSPGLMRNGYMAVRYDDVMMIHTDKRFSSDMARHGAGWVTRFLPRMFRLLTDSMVFKDDPDHKRLRGLVNKAFTPKMIQRMSADIDAMVIRIIDGFAGKDSVDLVEEFAVPLPLAVISDMLGVSDADREEFHIGTKRLVDGFNSGPLNMLKTVPTSRRLVRLFERLAEQRRNEPDDHLISALVRADDDGDRLGEDEIIAMIFLLLLAGHDTTANLIGSGTLALLEHPDQLERLRQRPELIDSAVEELLRYTSPVTCGSTRFALEDVEIGGTTLRRGSPILGMIISANRDEAVFDDPDVLDLGREQNRHIAFASGAHYCLGNQLARLEGRSAINALVQRFPRMTLAVPRSELTYKPTPALRGLNRLPLRLRGGSAA